MEAMDLSAGFWRGRRVLITGHTGFKGAWASLWLHELGADVTGYALSPPSTPSLYELARISDILRSVHGDIRDAAMLCRTMKEARPEVVLHFAAQSLVRESYKTPIETYQVNVLGTANVLEATRACPSVRSVLVVTSDKCYENREWLWGYRENEALGGRDPYSSSKACAEIVSGAYRASFFSDPAGPFLATARAGNVIGGGDWADDRLVPDIVRSLLGSKSIEVRNPDAVRPWQHVLDPLSGYLALAERLGLGRREFAQAWNFGPTEEGVKAVSWIVERALDAWGGGMRWENDSSPKPHEATLLKLDSSMARSRLSWRPRLDLPTALKWTVEWYKGYRDGMDMRQISTDQLRRYQAIP